MTAKTENEKIAGNYRVTEPIHNFKLRVKIAQEKPLLAELLETEEGTRDSNFLEEESRIFSWQEKVFSSFEAKFYSDETNCLTEYQKDYHRRIKETNIEGSLLYSYNQADSYYPDKHLLTKPYTSCLVRRSEAALPTLHNCKPFNQRYNKTVIDNVPADVRIRSNHYVYKECVRMYVMADLSHRDETQASASDDLETVLCTITYDRFQRVLTIHPDFSNDRFYTVTNSNGIRFNYWIENASKGQSPVEFDEEIKNLEREIKQRQIHREGEISRGLHLPPSHIRKVFLNLDIISAHDFDFDGLFVTYYIDMPEHWATKERERLFGRTQRCNLQDKSAYFSYTSSMALECQLNAGFNQTEKSPIYPRILISVSSLDSWTRYRTEGYGSLPLPLRPGLHDFNIQTWRPTGSIVNTLRRFFTGGTYELEDTTYCGIPSVYEGGMLSKEKLKVAPSGTVKIRVNVIHQTHPSVGSGLQLSQLYKIGTASFMNNVENVFEQFKGARERMIRIRNLNHY